MISNIDYRLYLVTDRDCLKDFSLVEAVEQALLGGVTMVQLREKHLNSSDFYQQALAVKAVCQRYQVPLLINDRVDIALAVDADGVHVGQSDLPANIARQILGSDKIIGVSARSVEQALQAKTDGADYLGVGAMFTTQTKTDAKTVCVATLAQIHQAVDLPIVAIGGINTTTLPLLQHDLAQAKIQVDGIAAVSAILGQQNIKHASQTIKTIIANYRQ